MTEYYSAIIKKEILQFVTTGMNLEGIMLSKISQTEKKTNTIELHLYVESKKTQITDTVSRLVVAELVKWVKMVKRHKLPVIISGDVM